jgi:TonB family protein
MNTQVDSGPQLLLDWHQHTYSAGWMRAGAGSVAVHVILVGFLVILASLPGPVPIARQEIASNLERAIPLVDPPSQLTQKDPNRTKVSKEVNVEGLLPHPATKDTIPRPQAVRQFKAPPPGRPVPEPVAPPRLAEPPKIDAQLNPAVVPPLAGPTNVPPPQIQTEEKPKLAFETPGQNGVATVKSPTAGRIAPPKTGVDEAIHSIARGSGGQGGMVVGDLDNAPSLPESLRLPPSPGRTQSSLELLSDPQGVDFKPYLIRILATVRRNWFAVLPESAHLGSRGQVLLQFVISRDGAVPKLVIATPSGAEALDRAAVAGISASVPFPPLPSEFRGREIRLQFSFKYNMR